MPPHFRESLQHQRYVPLRLLPQRARARRTPCARTWVAARDTARARAGFPSVSLEASGVLQLMENMIK